MANFFQRAAQKIKNVASGAYHQIAQNDGGQNYASVQAAAALKRKQDEERQRQIDQQKAAARAAADAAFNAKLKAKNIQKVQTTGDLIKSAGKTASTVGKLTFGNTAKVLNTAAATAQSIPSTFRGVVAQATGNQVALNNAIRDQNRAAQKFSKTGGIFNQGAVVNADEFQHATDAERLKRLGGAEVGAGVEVGGTLLGFNQARAAAAAAKAAEEANRVRQGIRFAQISAASAGASGVSSAGSQLADDGKIKRNEVIRDTAIGGALPGIGFGVGKVVKRAARGRKNVADIIEGEVVDKATGTAESRALHEAADALARGDDAALLRAHDEIAHVQTQRTAPRRDVPNDEPVQTGNGQAFPIDRDTDLKIGELMDRTAGVPLAPGHKRLYQGTENGVPTDWHFDNVDDLAQYFSNRSGNVDFNYRDVPAEQALQQTARGESVYRLADTPEVVAPAPTARPAETVLPEAPTPIVPSDVPVNQPTNDFEAAIEDYNRANETPVDPIDAPTPDAPEVNTAGQSRIAETDNIAELLPQEQQFIKEYAEHLKSLDDGLSGGDMIPDGQGGYVRTSEHSPFYRQYYAENGRAPSQAAFLQQAFDEVKAGRSDFQDFWNTLDRSPEPTKTRGFIANMQSQKGLDKKIRKGIDGKYDPITNKETLAAADQVIDADPEAAITRAKTDQDYSTETQAISLQLIDRLQAAGRHQDAIDVIEATAERATKAGQATQILAAYNRLTPEGILQAAQREVTNAKALNPEKYRDLAITPEQSAHLRQMAEELKAMPDGEQKNLFTREVLKEITRIVPTPGARKFTTLWKAGLLTGIKGAVGGNAIGNSAAVIMRKIADIPAAGIDQALALATGQRSKVFTLKGLIGGFGHGIKLGAKEFKSGISAEDQVTKLDYKPVNFGTGKLGRAAQKYTDTVFSFYGAADKPFYESALANNLEDLAKVAAKNQGLRGKAGRDFVKQTVAEPTDDILTQAVDAAQDATFKGKNALGSALSNAKRGLATKGGSAGEVTGEVLMPFTGVPAAIAKHVYDYSPAGATVQTVKAIVQASKGNFDQAAQRRLSEALGRGITGTGAMWIGLQLKNAGVMTLGYPTDPDERALWESEGKQPYSLKIGGKWRSMNYTGSIMSLMAIGGQVAEANKEGNGGFGGVVQGALSSGKAIIGSTPLQGIQGAIDAVTDTDRYGEKFVNGLAGSLVPTLVKDFAVAGDKLQRQVNNPIDAIASRIPGIRNGLAIKSDVFGNDLPRTTTAVGSVIDPFKSSQARTTDITAEMRRLQDKKLGITPPKIDKSGTFDGVDAKLDPKMQDELKRRTNTMVQSVWNQIIGSDEYKALSDQDKKRALEGASGDIAAVERYKFASDHKLGQFAPGFSGKATQLSGKQDALLQGYNNFEANSYTNPGGSKIAKDISTNGRKTLTTVESMSTDKRTAYLADPKNNYQYQISKYENDLKSGKLSDVDQYTKLQELGSLKVKSGYSKDVLELYGLSKVKLNDYLGKKGGAAQETLNKVLALDQQLADEGYISKPKFGGAIGSAAGGGSGGSGKKKKNTAPAPKFGSFRLVDAPTTQSTTMNSVMKDLSRAFGDIKVLQGTQFAPGSDSSSISIKV